MGQQAPWHNNFARIYDARSGYSIPPPPPPAQPQSYNPKLHAQMSNGMMIPPPPPPPNDGMSATYVPNANDGMSATYVPSGGDTYGEGVGIPSFGPEEAIAALANPRMSWTAMTPLSGTDTNTTTPMDETRERERLYSIASSTQTRKTSNSSNATANISPEVAAQWPLDTVLIWLAKNQFSKDWQETFKVLDIHGSKFLELGSTVGGRGNFGMMHQQVYPQLLKECMNSGVGWDPPKEREEGKRMRRLVRSIVSGKPVDPAKMVTSVGRDSVTTGYGNSLPSAGTDPADSPNVSISSWTTFLSPYADMRIRLLALSFLVSPQGDIPRIGRPTTQLSTAAP